MKKKSFFSQIIFLVIAACCCALLTIGAALFFGSVNKTVFDFKNLNFSNMIPVLIIGGFISCVAIGIIVLFISRDVFVKIKNYFEDTNKNGGKEK